MKNIKEFLDSFIDEYSSNGEVSNKTQAILSEALSNKMSRIIADGSKEIVNESHDLTDRFSSDDIFNEILQYADEDTLEYAWDANDLDESRVEGSDYREKWDNIVDEGLLSHSTAINLIYQALDGDERTDFNTQFENMYSY